MSKQTIPPVLCFGEILWDSLPQGLFPGGAPFNVAYHLRQLNARAVPVTAVGGDTLGEELIRRLTDWHIETIGVTTHPDSATGLARVNIREGSPAFEIVENVAWDRIEVSPPLLKLAGTADALVFGTLAQRSADNRRQLAALQAACRQATKIFDVNLRSPFDQPERVWELARTADVIKLNHDELFRLLERKPEVDQIEAAARDFSGRSYCVTICVTAGAHGAGMLDGGKWHWENARPIKITDTVGAGDAFLAALVQGLRERRLSPSQMLQRACRLAEFVASQPGATPRYNVNAAGEFQPGCA